MKKLVYIFILLSFINCKAQKISKVEQQIIIPKITKDFETFDIEKYNKEAINEKVEIKNDKIFKVFLNYSNGYSESNYNDKSIFYTVKNFYLNGNIEIKGVRYNNGSEYGIWYEFDQNGKLIKEINMDFGYEFGWLAIIKYCQKNDIVLEKGYPKRGGIKTEIYKNEEDGKKVWTISYYDYKKEQYFEVTLDGTTGKELKRRTLELIGG